MIDELIDFVVARLCEDDNPKIETLKMQVAMIHTKESLARKQEKKKAQHEFKSEKLISEIVQKTKDAEVFGDIVIYILHMTDLLEIESPELEKDIEKETMKALETVFVFLF